MIVTLILCIFLFLSIYVSLLEFMFTLYITFSLHNSGHPATHYSIFGVQCIAPLYCYTILWIARYPGLIYMKENRQ
jgi:hypothetical protein